MNETLAQKSKLVVACLDGGDDGDRAMQYAIEEAQRRGTGLRLVHVAPDLVPYAPMSPVLAMPNMKEIGSRILQDGLERCHELDPDLYVEGHLATGSRDSHIVEASEGASAVVLGTRGWSTMDVFGGSTTVGVAARAHSPLIGVPPSWKPGRAVGAVVVGVDQNAGPDVVLRHAFEVAKLHDAELTIVHAWMPPHPYLPWFGQFESHEWQRAMTNRLSELTAAIRSAYPEVPTQLMASFVLDRDALTNVVSAGDLLVLGRHRGNAHLFHRLGSVAHHALRRGTCPVEIVPVVE